MKEIQINEFLRLNDLSKIRALKDIAQGNLKLKESENKMAKVSVIEPRVKELLEEYPQTRENDNLLYVTYLEEYHYIDFNKDVFINYEKMRTSKF